MLHLNNFSQQWHQFLNKILCLSIVNFYSFHKDKNNGKFRGGEQAALGGELIKPKFKKMPNFFAGTI